MPHRTFLRSASATRPCWSERLKINAQALKPGVLSSRARGAGARRGGSSSERRQAYAAEITRSAHVSDPRIEAAFAAVPREDFAGTPPWRIGSGGLFGLTSSDDPARLYEDVLVAIDAERGINNGQPSLHAQAIDALGAEGGRDGRPDRRRRRLLHRDPRRARRAKGRVIAYEIAPDIAARAAANLARYPQVEVRARSGVEDLPQADAIYVNAAATHPLRAWLDALKPGGRLVFPLQAAGSSGAMLIVTRPEHGEAWPARLADGRGVHPLRGRAGYRDGPEARPGVPPRRHGAGCARCASAARRARPTGSEATAGRCRPSRPGRAWRAAGPAPEGRNNLRASFVQVNASKKQGKVLAFASFWQSGFSKGYRRKK